MRLQGGGRVGRAGILCFGAALVGGWGVGCGNSPAGVAVPNERLVVTEALRAMCRTANGGAVSDETIAAVLEDVARARESGASREDILAAEREICGASCASACGVVPDCDEAVEADCRSRCETCIAAIIEQIYSP